MKKSIMFMILLITLNGCSSKYMPAVVTEYVTLKDDVPDELLTAERAPDASMLDGVEVCKGTEQLKAYGTALLQTNYTNTQKIKALRELLR